jgi:hypothetical protein
MRTRLSSALLAIVVLLLLPTLVFATGNHHQKPKVFSDGCETVTVKHAIGMTLRLESVDGAHGYQVEITTDPQTVTDIVPGMTYKVYLNDRKVGKVDIEVCPTPEPTPEPTPTPTPTPTTEPTPTATPTSEPTPTLNPSPTATMPTLDPSPTPTANPTLPPTDTSGTPPTLPSIPLALATLGLISLSGYLLRPTKGRRR